MLAFEDFNEGRVFALGPMRVDRDEVIDFATQFDPQPFHLDDEAANASMLGALSASGWHTCSMLMRMMCDAFLLSSTSQGAPGVDHIKWLKPVLPGDVLGGTVEVMNARPSRSRPELGLATLAATVTNQDGDTVLKAEYVQILLTRAAAEARP